ncbi:ATP-binding protein [Phenylobacterium ferrooxidans]|uniref:ATP-binding protein n=1 Tax=Phenylobacterium ferrooxidans TaxID=2982689 RepID=A0ABW6CQ11_9CAUL
MTSRLPSPVDPGLYLGTVTEVTASQVQVNFPNATARPERRGLSRGAVGDFVFIDCERVKLLGRVIETRIPDGERLSVEPRLGETPDPNPIGRVQLLAAVEQGSDELRRGIPAFPRIGDSVHLADPRLLAQLIRNAVTHKGDVTLSVGRIDAADGVDICLPPEKVFGRHAGIFGATGGGKSWTLATLIQELKGAGGKAILLDPTGEFVDIDPVDQVFVFEAAAGHKLVHFPYRKVTEDDLFSLFRPSGQSQGPKLREAIKSLKLVEALAGVAPAGVTFVQGLVAKRLKPRTPFYTAIAASADVIHSPFCDFDISKLADQIKAECVHSSDFEQPQNFGKLDPATGGYCETLVSRIATQINSPELQCLFQTNGASLVEELAAFLADPTKDVAVISFREVRLEHNTREILLNIIGRHLLGLARQGAFRERPLVVFLDEAHQFLGQTVGDEYGSTQLDSFGLIAKEGRKYGLTCVLATQRPRDIPHDVLSQLGTLFVHRLTNKQDRDTVESACGDLDRGAAQFIPMLGPGEAIIIGPDLPAPLPVFIHPPTSPPDSRGPSYQAFWKSRRDAASQAAQAQAAQTAGEAEAPAEE